MTTQTQTKERTVAWLAAHAQPITAQGEPCETPCGIRPRYLVPSQSRPGHLYLVILHRENMAAGRCGCEWAQRGGVCAHIRGGFQAFSAWTDNLFAVKTALVSNPSPFVYEVWREGEARKHIVTHDDEESGCVARCSCGCERASWGDAMPCVHIAVADAYALHHIPRAWNWAQAALRANWNTIALPCGERVLCVGEEGDGI